MLPPLSVTSPAITPNAVSEAPAASELAAVESAPGEIPLAPLEETARGGSFLAAAQRFARPVAAVILAGVIGFGLAAGSPLHAQSIPEPQKIELKADSVRTVIAAEDLHAGARVLSRQALYYTAGADAALDRPANVRAGSGIAWFGSRLAIVQDDAHFIVLHDPATGKNESIALPAGKDGRRVFDEKIGNKKLKYDLESIAVLDTREGQVGLAFGSGSHANRETIVVLRGAGDAVPTASTVNAGRLYAAFRAAHGFSGSELNIEGTADLGDGRVRFFQRGNGAAKDGFQPVNASVDVSKEALLAFLADPEHAPVPELSNAVQFDLGALGGVKLTFNDALRVKGGVLYLAAAEASPDAIRDGAVSGTVLGFIDDQGRARWTRITDEHGKPLIAKPEGLCLDRAHPGRVLMVTDSDDPDAASELLTVSVRGFPAR